MGLPYIQVLMAEDVRFIFLVKKFILLTVSLATTIPSVPVPHGHADTILSFLLVSTANHLEKSLCMLSRSVSE